MKKVTIDLLENFILTEDALDINFDDDFDINFDEEELSTKDTLLEIWDKLREDVSFCQSVVNDIKKDFKNVKDNHPNIFSDKEIQQLNTEIESLDKYLTDNRISDSVKELIVNLDSTQNDKLETVSNGFSENQKMFHKVVSENFGEKVDINIDLLSKLTNVKDALNKVLENNQKIITFLEQNEDRTELSETEDTDWSALFDEAKQNQVVEYNGKTVSLEQLWSIYANKEFGENADKILNLGQAFKQEALSLGFTQKTNPFIAFLRENINYNFTRDNWSGLHNSFVNKYISSNDLVDESKTNRVLHCKDLFNHNGRDVEEYLKQVKKFIVSIASSRTSGEYEDQIKRFFLRNDRNDIDDRQKLAWAFFFEDGDPRKSTPSQASLEEAKLRSLQKYEELVLECFPEQTNLVKENSKEKITASLIDQIRKLSVDDAKSYLAMVINANLSRDQILQFVANYPDAKKLVPDEDINRRQLIAKNLNTIDYKETPEVFNEFLVALAEAAGITKQGV